MTSMARGIPIVATDTTVSAPTGASSSASSLPARSANLIPWSTEIRRAIVRSSAIETSGISSSWEPTVTR